MMNNEKLQILAKYVQEISSSSINYDFRGKYIDAVYRFLLSPGGELSAIVSNHWKLSDERKCRDFRQWLQDVKAEVQDLDRGEFKESGTDVATSIIYLVKH